ncbi:MAG: chemotaxis protein CheW [Clostridiales Family XIII bacterium]|jgi:chemotaxis signal transduction protein|nr:chemotaxis protein CheW [Clostridiales Family XIII bacterium]
MNEEVKNNLYLILNAGSGEYAVSADEVRSIVTPEKLFPVQGAPEQILGLVEFQHDFVGVVSARKLFGVAEQSAEEGKTGLLDLGIDREIVVIVENASGRFGLKVDGIENIEPLQSFTGLPVALEGMRYISGLARREKGEGAVGILDMNRVAEDAGRFELPEEDPGLGKEAEDE